MDFQFAKAPAGGAAPVRLPQPNASVRATSLLWLPQPKPAPQPAPTRPRPHQRAEQARYQAQCRVAMSF